MTTPPSRKLLAGFRIKLRLAAICVALLSAGAWLRPPERSALSALQERTAPLLEERVEQREAARPRPGFDELVPLLHTRGVPIEAAAPPPVADDFGGADRDQPRSFGIAVAGAYLLTHEAALGGATTAAVPVTPSRAAAGRVAAFDPATGLVLLQVDDTLDRAAIIATETPSTGARAAAAVTVAGRDVVVPIFVTSVAADRYGVSGGALAPGMPIFNLSGDLLAVAGPPGTAAPVNAALPRLLAIVRGAAIAPSSIGIAYQAIDEQLRAAFGDGGVIVVDVVDGGPADRAGIRTGDVVTAVSGATISGADADGTLSALPTASAAEITIRRAARTQAITVTPAPAYEVRALAREARDDGRPVARALFPAAALAAARVPANAIVIEVNGRAVASPAQAARDLARRRADSVVLLEIGGRRFYAVVGTGR